MTVIDVTRGRKPVFSEELRARVAGLLRTGRTSAEVATLLRSEGGPVPSERWIDQQRKGKAIAAPIAAPVEGDALGEALGSLRRQASALEKMSQQALEDENIAAVAQIARAQNATAALIGKLVPPVPLSPEDDPGVAIDAEWVRAKLGDLLSRAMKRRAGK